LEETTKIISGSMISEAEPQRQLTSALSKKKSDINSELLGNLKEFSKNLKLPSEKKK
jgi:hypothetical protein